MATSVSIIPLRLLILFLPILPTSTSLPSQHLTLLSIKSTLVDPQSSLQSWKSSVSYDGNSSGWCDWSGVTCDGTNGDIVSLDLSDRNLSGVISPVIRLLGFSLLHLNLSRNSFSGPLPSAIFDLTSLRTLDVSHNDFNSTFPSAVENLRYLSVFNAYSNSFVGRIPSGFSDLRRLRYLNLGGSFFSGEIPASFGGLRKLRFLHLAGNLLNGSLPLQIGFLQELEHLEIGYNEYFGGIPENWGNLSSLVYLDASSGNLSGNIPSKLGRMTRLESLFLFKNAFTGSIPDSFSNLVELRALDLSDNRLSGKIPSGLSSMLNLTLLSFMNNEISGDIPEGIGDLPMLETLLLWNNSLTGKLPASLGRNGKLVKLDVSTNSLSGPIPTGLCNGNRLSRLILFSNRFDSELPPSLASCPSLWRIRIESNQLSGRIPPGFGFLPNLTYMDLSCNNLSGEIPGDLGHASKLQLLNISNNPLKSSLPKTIWLGQSLEIFSARYSQLRGPIPRFQYGCENLYKVDLAGNDLVGSIPWDVGVCRKMLSFDVSRNRITGLVPWELAELPDITDIDLSRNFLSGSIPSSFDNCTTLENFNVSFNRLVGEIPCSGSILINIHPSSFAGNDGLCGVPVAKACQTAHLKGLGIDQNDGGKRTMRSPGAAVLWIAAGAFGVGVLVLIGGTRFFQGNKPDENRECAGPWKLTAFQKLNFTADDVTNCVEATENIIGVGSMGTVYRADVKGRETIAVKKLWGKQKETTDTMLATKRRARRKRSGVMGLAEVEVLGNVRHRNIVRLLGCCSNKETTLLLYEYMPNGSLEDLLHRRCCHASKDGVGDWLTRYKIAVGVAEGLCYLHHDCDPVVVHRDLKPSNILLDADMEARLADFGVAKLVHSNQPMSVIAGSYGYIAPEYAYTLQVDEKSDIYSFGVVLMEMVSGRKAVEAEFGEVNTVAEWVRERLTGEELQEVFDKRVVGAGSKAVREDMLLMLRIALLCTARNPIDRPSMREVVSMIRDARPRRKEEALPTEVNGMGDCSPEMKPKGVARA